MSLIDLTIVARDKDLGGFSVRRVLPYAKRRMVGPFVFLDHMGPAQFAAGHGIDVRPHPHIGLSTVTYLFEGSIQHRDSIGSVQEVQPGAVNWMTSGRGIAHSERTGATVRAQASAVHGLQSWVALPREFEEIAPEFFHHAAESLPAFTHNGVSLKVISGMAYGHEAPVKIYSPLYYVEAQMPAGTTLQMPDDYADRALYVISGRVRIGDTVVDAHSMPVFGRGERVVVEAQTSAHLMLLGGEPLAEQRFINWNFVSSSEERIVQAQEDWKNGRFATVVGDDKEFIPLPE